jgi:CheY-like chemotaxis protein
VDDDADACARVTKVLELSGARVSAFSSTREAIDPLMDDTGPRPDILISDLSMPGEGGISLMGKLREWEQTRGYGAMPAVALSAFGRPQDRKRALEAGFQAHVTKPAESAELVIMVESLIENGLRSDNNTGKRGERVGSRYAPG